MNSSDLKTPKLFLPALVFAFLFIFLTGSQAFASTFTSTGGTSLVPLDWNNAATWTLTKRIGNTTNTIPGAGDKAIIAPGHFLTVTSATTCDELDISGQLTINIPINGSGDRFTVGSIDKTTTTPGTLIVELGDVYVTTMLSLIKLDVEINGARSSIIYGGDSPVERSSPALATEYINLTNSAKFILENLGKGGSVKRQDDVLFPVGSGSYTPIVIDNKSFSQSATTLGDFSVMINDGVFLNGSDGPRAGNVVNKTWEVALLGNSPALAGAAPTSNATITFYWNATDELPAYVLNNSRIGQFTGGSWSLFPTSNITYTPGARSITLNSMPATGATTFPKFAIMNGTLTTLPVSLTSFKAVRNTSGVALTWETASEKNNTGFEVQSSLDGKVYEAIGFVASHNGTSASVQRYSFTDKTAAKEGLVYYRLKQIDLDGTFEYYTAKVIDLGRIGTAVTAYPNPFQNQFELNLETATAQAAQLVITDMTGKTVYETTAPLQKGANKLNVTLNNQPAGLYILKASTGNQTFTSKLLKH